MNGALSINNQPLPAASALKIEMIPPAADPLAPPVRLRLLAQWEGLTAEEAEEILSPTAGAFSRGCYDPRLNQTRGFPAALKSGWVKGLGSGRWQMHLVLEESA